MENLIPEEVIRTAVSGDEVGILRVFAEVASEVPTSVLPQTKELIRRYVGSGQSQIAIDRDGVVIGYALAEPYDCDTLSLVYLGVAKSARDRHVGSALVAKLKDIGAPIITDVRSDNKSSMVERFEALGFVKTPTVFEGTTKMRWDNPADVAGVVV